MRCPGCHRNFKDHVVLGVGNKGPPQIKNRLLVRHHGESSEDGVNRFTRKGNPGIWTSCDIFIFGEQWNRESQFELAPIRRQKNLVAGTRR